MNIVEKLDLAIKLKEKGTIDGAYTVPYKNGTLNMPTYMTNDEWKAFLDSMPTEARKEYGDGDGGELTEKNGRPPKMASYGSSSHMIYVLSHNKDNFHFEKKLPTTLGGKANLDGFFEDEDRYIFVEAKCHEPYSLKKNAVSECYADLYEYINERMAGSLFIEMNSTESKKTHYMDTEYFADGEALERFDLKQMICHLLGIATALLRGTLERKQVDFIYLLYDPTELDIEGRSKNIIDSVYERTCYECNLVDFAELFRTVLDFLRETRYTGVMTDKEADEVIFKFTFTLASQEFYPILIQ